MGEIVPYVLGLTLGLLFVQQLLIFRAMSGWTEALSLLRRAGDLVDRAVGLSILALNEESRSSCGVHSASESIMPIDQQLQELER